jgi:hypothetical protein
MHLLGNLVLWRPIQKSMQDPQNHHHADAASTETRREPSLLLLVLLAANLPACAWLWCWRGMNMDHGREISCSLNPYFSACFLAEQYFSVMTNQRTVFSVMVFSEADELTDDATSAAACVHACKQEDKPVIGHSSTARRRIANANCPLQSPVPLPMSASAIYICSVSVSVTRLIIIYTHTCCMLTKLLVKTAWLSLG